MNSSKPIKKGQIEDYISNTTQTALDNKVDKVSGMSLLADSEINRLLSLVNSDNTNRIINITLSQLGLTGLRDVTDIAIEAYINSQEYVQALNENLYFVVTENIIYNFDVTATNWLQVTLGEPVTIQSFTTFLQNQNSSSTFTISDFRYSQDTGRLMCNINNLTGLTTFTFPDKTGVRTINSLNIPVALLNFDYQGITNLTGFIPNFSTKDIYFNNNEMTQTTYAELEPWADSLPVRPLVLNPAYTGEAPLEGSSGIPQFINDLNMYFSGNVESIQSSSLQSILISKNINVIY